MNNPRVGKSLVTNIGASFASQVYVALIGIVTVPTYIRFMGAEAYGLVGFFAMLQAWFGLLDAGLSPTMARETSRFRGGALDAAGYRQFVRALEKVFAIISLVGGVTLLLASDAIARNWLKASQLPITQVLESVQLMSVVVSLRWVCGLYRGAVSGSEELVWLSTYNSLIATLRFVGVMPIIVFVSASTTTFFRYQLCIAVVELAVLVFKARRLLPPVAPSTSTSSSWTPLKPVLKFSLMIAFTSAVWVIVTQTDKLVLSKLLPLADYGSFTLAVLVAGGVLIVSGPVGVAIMPRLAKLDAEQNRSEFIRVYRQGTQLVAWVAGSVAISLLICAEPLLWLWTKNRTIARAAAPILSLYAAGNGVLAVSSFPYYMQYAKGNLRLHFLGNAIFVVILVPAIVWATSRYGGVGAGIVWLSLNAVNFGAWLPIVHHRFAPGINAHWYWADTLAIFLASSIGGLAVRILLPAGAEREMQFLAICATAVATLAAGGVASSVVREKVRSVATRQFTTRY